MAYIHIPSFTKKGSFTNDTEFVIVVDGVEHLVTFKTLSDTFGNTPELLAEIQAEITTLKSIIDALPTENPAAPIALKISDTPIIDGIYKPTEAGTYPNAGGLIYTPSEGITYFIRNNGIWIKDVTPVNFIPNGKVEDGDINAVSGDTVFKHVEFVNFKNLKYKIVSDNLVNEKSEDYLKNAILSAGGILFLDQPSNYEVSGFIPVEPNTKYTPNQKDNVCFYDLNQNYITGLDGSRPTLSFETPSNCLYVRLNAVYNGGQLRMVKGDLSTFPSDIDQYEIEIADVDNVPVTIPMPDIPVIPTNISAFNNDAGYSTLSQVASAVSPLVSMTFLTTNYQNKVENKNYVDYKIDGLIVGTDNIENQSITEDKISVELFESLANGSPITINNNPDENDLTANGAVIELKDRSNYIYLKKGVNITQALVNTWVDKIVSVRHNHVITENINFTSNITLQFDGGYFTATSARKLNGGGCVIIADRYWIFRNIFTDPLDSWMNFTTKFKTEKSYPEWFGSGSDVNVLDCTCIALCNTKFNMPIDLQNGKTYIINKSLGGSIRGNFATLKKNPTSIDINVLSAIPTGSNNLVINVDSGSADFSKLKVGMQVEFVNKEGQARKVNLAYKVITAISGNQITLYGLSGGTSFAAGEAQMINCFKGIQLGASEIIENLYMDGSRSAFAHNRTYWEFSQEIFISSTAKNAKVLNCFISNAQSEGITVGGNNTLVKGNIIQNCGGNGVHLSGSYNSKIDHNEIYDTNKKPSTGHNEGAITYSNEVYLTHITNNVFDGCLSGIGSIDSGFNSDSFIIGNTFRRYKTHGIDMLSTTGGGNIVNNTIISNNRFCGKFLPKTGEAYYLPTLENNFNESDGYSINLASNGYLLEGIVISDNIFECGSVFAQNAEIALTGNTFTEKGQTFGSSFVKDVITFKDTTGIMSGNYIVSVGTNRQAILNIDSFSQIGILSNTFKGDNIKSTGTTTDLTGNKVIQL